MTKFMPELAKARDTHSDDPMPSIIEDHTLRDGNLFYNELVAIKLKNLKMTI